MHYLLFKDIKAYVYCKVIFIFKLWLKSLKLIFKYICLFLEFRKLLVRNTRSRDIKQFVKVLLLFSRKSNNEFIRSLYYQKISSNIKVISHKRYIRNLISIKLNQNTKQFIYKKFSKSLIIPLYS